MQVEFYSRTRILLLQSDGRILEVTVPKKEVKLVYRTAAFQCACVTVAGRHDTDAVYKRPVGRTKL
jgi:hypothetical protein